MATTSEDHSTVCVSAIIEAPARAIYRAFMDPEALASWLPPEGMSGQVYAFEPPEGGAFSMGLTHTDPDVPARGKTTDRSDAFQGRFVELVPYKRIVQSVEFDSNDPAFAGAMTIDWSLSDVPGGTEVTVRCALRQRPAGHPA